MKKCVYFACLVKAYDSVQHPVIQKSLEIVGASIELINGTMKLHHNFKVDLKINDKESTFPCGFGMKQGDSEAIALFTNMIKLVAVDISNEFAENDIDLAIIKCFRSHISKIKHKPTKKLSI